MLTSSRGTGGPDTVRRLNAPAPVRVKTGADGRPCRVHQRDRWRAVIEIRQHYRTDDRWWTDEPVARDYFDLLLEDGRPLTVFHDRLARRWYGQRYG